MEGTARMSYDSGEIDKIIANVSSRYRPTAVDTAYAKAGEYSKRSRENELMMIVTLIASQIEYAPGIWEWIGIYFLMSSAIYLYRSIYNGYMAAKMAREAKTLEGKKKS